jgi:putative methanogenesis marker protein 8
VRIKDGKVEVLSEPRIVHCPLHEMLYGIKTIDKEAVRHSVEMKIGSFGFCCEDRLFDDTMVVPYGSSEIIRVCIEQKLLDCAVTVCEGAGTVITANPSLAQAIGARLTGIIKTSPIKGIIKHIKNNNGIVLDENSAEIDQAKGVLKAADLGFKRIAVTVASFFSQSMEEIRKIEMEKGINVAIFSVCNTCASEEDVERILAYADIVCASASKLIREKVGPKALMQLGVTIPVFALTKSGKNLMLAYLKNFNDKLVVFRIRKLPYLVEGKGPKIEG